MTQDVRLKRTDEGFFDLNVVDSVFETVDGFETAIIISLLTDARAASSVVQSPARRRGWVGNILTADTGRQLGSTLWTFEQARLTGATLNDMSVAAQESLSWMVEDGIAKAVSAVAIQNGIRSVVINISITTIEGKQEQYAVLWRKTGEL